MRWDGSAFEASLRRLASEGLDNCIGVNACMRACPVNRLGVDQSELDSVLVSGAWTDRVRTFVTECVQCGDCTLACPAGVHRDALMLLLKAMLRPVPRQWKSYYLLKGRKDQSLLISLYDLVARLSAGPLGRHVDKKRLEKRPLLFYFGCYVFSPSGAPAATLALADRLGLDYEVLAGVRSCCGWPQYLSGRMGFGQQMLEHLGTLIAQADPELVVSGCAECYAALLRLRRRTGARWKALTTTEWLLSHADGLEWHRREGALAFHDSCHISKRAGKPWPARELIGRMAGLAEIAASPHECVCCGYYNLHVNAGLNHGLHREKLERVKACGAAGLAVECVTCWESFRAEFQQAGVPLVDLMVAAEQATRPGGEHADG